MHARDPMRTACVCILFVSLAAGATNRVSEQEHRRARSLMEQVEDTANPFRLLTLGVQIKNALDTALAHDPDNIEVRLDLVRFYVVAPRIIGGGADEARAEAAEIARRDAPAGFFARGYIAYREKEYGDARGELREAVRNARDEASRARAAMWLGWLSQEMQQYDEAFAMCGSRCADAMPRRCTRSGGPRCSVRARKSADERRSRSTCARRTRRGRKKRGSCSKSCARSSADPRPAPSPPRSLPRTPHPRGA